MPARMTEPAVGASTWASGNHVCTGHIGIFTAKDAKKASHSQVCIAAGKSCAKQGHGIEVVPAFQYIAMMAISINTEPSERVEEELERSRRPGRLPPHTPMMMYIGIRPAFEEDVKQHDVERAEDADHHAFQGSGTRSCRP
jgi:hypothetical protein